jgi:hypothetical protein
VRRERTIASSSTIRTVGLVGRHPEGYLLLRVPIVSESECRLVAARL